MPMAQSLASDRVSPPTEALTHRGLLGQTADEHTNSLSCSLKTNNCRENIKRVVEGGREERRDCAEQEALLGLLDRVKAIRNCSRVDPPQAAGILLLQVT